MFVSWLRQRGVRARTVNTCLQALNAFGRWLHTERHSDELVRLQLLRTERRVVETLSEVQIRQLLRFKPHTFPAAKQPIFASSRAPSRLGYL